VTDPFPEPDAPAAMLRKELLLAAVHEHPDIVVTCSE
jgi:hypothetical protein